MNALALATIDTFKDKIICCDVLTLLLSLPDASVNCVVTSPPYFGLRDYGVKEQIGLEETPHAYVARLLAVFQEVKRVLRDDGTLWVNLGDSYNGSGRGWQGENNKGVIKHEQRQGFHYSSAALYGLAPKNLLGIPWRVAFALQDDGWILRSDIIWHKPNPMPESVRDRPTKSHEYVFLFTKQGDYWWDQDAVREPFEYSNEVRVNTAYNQALGRKPTRPYKFKLETSGRNVRSVWTIPTEPTQEAHFATYPQKLVERCIMVGCPKDGIVLDPFMGSGTTALVARRLGRHYIGCDMNPAYVQMARDRLANTDPFSDTVFQNGMIQMSLFAV